MAKLPAEMKTAIEQYWIFTKSLCRCLSNAPRLAIVGVFVGILVGVRVAARNALAAAPALAVPMQTCGIMFFGDAWASVLPIIRWAVLVMGIVGAVWLVWSFNPEAHTGSTGGWLILVSLAVIIGFDWVGFWNQIGSLFGTGSAPQAMTCGIN